MPAITQVDLANALDTEAIRKIGLSLGAFLKTIQGKLIVDAEGLFVLNGRIYQGYKGICTSPSEDQLTDEELEGATDVDGSKPMVYQSRSDRLAGRKVARDKESNERRKIRIAAERDELELLKLRREMGMEGESPALAVQPEPPPTLNASCPACQKQFKDARALNAHRMGAKH